MSPTGEPADDLGRLWEWQAVTGCRGYSPLYERICHTVAHDAAVLALVRRAPPPAHQPLVLLAAVHYLLLGGLDHPLGAVYAGTSDEDPGRLFRDLCLAHADELLPIMATHHVQTNEVGRSALIGPALSWVADHRSGPLHLVDVGTSAGLNLLCDRYRLDYGPAGATGAADAPVRVECRVVSGAPPIRSALPPVGERVGIDREPVDIADPDAARWLLACVWPDTNRLERTERAIDAALVQRPRLVRGDAVDALPAVLGELPSAGVACVITTWAFSYLHMGDRVRFVELLAQAGRERPVLWIAGDSPGIVELVEPGPLPEHEPAETSVLSAVAFDGGAPRPQLLALVHPHGLWIDWRASASAAA
jgi:hypothetical protein